MKKIILIEDDIDIRETTSEILELADYEVITVENGKKGIELAKIKKPDLIICDIMMPDLDGYGVLRILSKNSKTSTIPFIFLTAKADKNDVRKGMNLGADDYITKPFDDAELLEAVEIRIQRSESLKGYNMGVEGLNNFINEARGLKELKGLSKNRKTKTYKKKEAIYREDDYANYMYLIIKGKVKCIKTDYFGKDFTNEILSEGEFIGYMTFFSGDDYHETAIAMELTEVAVIPKQDFLSLIQKNRDVATNFIKMLAGHVRDRENRLLQIAYAPLRERVADTLLKLKKEGRMLNDSPDTLLISREDLANLIGTVKESLIRSLSDLKKEGLIDTDRQKIIILDEEGLKKTVAGF